VINLDDYHLNGATITIKNLDNYWTTEFKVQINQDQDITITTITNGSYDQSSKMLIASSGSSRYAANKMSFTLSGVVLSEINLEVKDNNGQSIAQNAG